MGAGLLPLLSFAVPPGCTPGCAPPWASEMVENVRKVRNSAKKRCCKDISKIYSSASGGASWRKDCYLDTETRQSGYLKQKSNSLHPNQDVTTESPLPSVPSGLRFDRCRGSRNRRQAGPWRTVAQLSAAAVSIQVRRIWRPADHEPCEYKGC